MRQRPEGDAPAIRIATVDDVRAAERGIRRHVSAALLSVRVSLDGDGDVVVILSGRNVDDDQFRAWISPD